MPAKRNITRSDWANAISSSGGIVTGIATKLGVHRSTVYRYLKDQPSLVTAIRDELEICKDLAEHNIREALRSKNVRVSMWYLARKARDRGYGTQSKLDINIASVSSPRLCLPDDGRDTGEPNAAPTS